MLKKLLFLYILVLSYCTSAAQNYNWITPNQVYLKTYVINNGIYRIQKSDFESAGITTSGIDPRTVKVYYKGNQVPIYFYGEQDGVFNDSDYFDFYGQRNYGGLTKYYDTYNNVAYTKDEYINIYSDTSVYWIGWGGSFGQRLTDFSTPSSTPYPLDYYFSKFHSEKDTYYSLGENWAPTDYRNFSNDLFQGEGWYWKSMAFMNTASDTFSTPYKTLNTQTCFLKIFAYPGNRNTTIYNDHHIVLKINNNTFPDTLYTDDFRKIDTTVSFPSSYLNSSGVNTVTIRYAPPAANSAGIMNLDMVDISYTHRFEFENNSVRFNSTVTDVSPDVFKIKGYNPSNPVSIYDVKNNLRITTYQVSADTLIFSGIANGNYEIYNKYITLKPFRIKQKQVPDLVSGANGADYLLVYNKLFESQAEQLRQFRASHSSMRSKKAEIEDIYDIFNYGMEDPVAIRNLVINATGIWQFPPVKFLCLFGRGSLDPKKNITTSQYYQNLVPVYGNPVTDGYFANLHYGSFTYSWQVDVGRIPATTVQEAQSIVNKLIAYETQPLDNWVKEPIFITSGRSRATQIPFIAQSESFINAYITPPPISSLPVKIYKNDSIGYPTFNLRDSTKNSINRGGLITNYIGESGDTKWENCLDDPSILTNGLKLPAVFSMTCFTGQYANPDVRSFGESFFFNQNGGAVGLVGTTGWSFSGSGNDFNGYLIRSMKQDSCRYLGDIVKFANLAMKNDSANFAVRNTLNCYNLIGDPATRLLLPTHPEFDINLQDYTLSSPNPAIGDNDLLTVTPKNLGTYADSCKIRFKILKFNQTYKQKDTIIHFFAYKTNLNYNFKIDTSGIFDMMVIMDPDNWYPLDDKSNNIIEFPIILKNSAYVPIKPEDNMVIQTDSVNFIGLNPQINLINNVVKVILELDTNSAFNSGMKQTYFKIVNSGVVSKFKIRIPVLDTNILYYWRATATLNNDTTGWAQVRKFCYRPPVIQKVPKGDLPGENSKVITGMPVLKSGHSTLSDSIVTILKNSSRQFTNNLINIRIDSLNNFGLSSFISTLYAKGYGMNAFEASYFVINNLMYLSDGDTNTGLNLCKVRKLDCKVREFKNFVFNNASYNDSVLNYLNTFDATSYLMVYNASYVPTGVGFNAAVKDKFRQFGSVYADTIPVIGWFHTWSFIGFLGAGPSDVSEQYHPCCPVGWIPAISQLNPLSFSTSGSLTSFIGPAQHWKNFRWDRILYPNSNITFDVYGIDRNNLTTLLYSNLTNNNFISLDTVNSYIYTNLKLVTNLKIDTVVGLQSPAFKSLTFSYQPPAELVIDSIAFHDPGAPIGYGDEIKVNANCFNVGYTNAYGVVGNWFVYTNSGQKYILKTDTLNRVLYVDSMFTSKKILMVNYFPPDVRKFYDIVTIYYEVKALGQQNDYYDFNNTASMNIVMKNGPVAANKISVIADGIQLQGGDYVRQKPEMTVKSVDGTLNFAITDSSTFKVYINNVFFSVQNNNNNDARNNDARNIDARNIEKKNDNKKSINTLSFYPDLRIGDNNLKFITKSSDGTNADTVAYSVFVSNELSIKDLVNYPNPMKNETSFLFNLAGAVRPAGCKIKIYSVSGRLVKIINSPVNIGYNQISWDGRDTDGEYMANGVYLYQLIIDGDAKKETFIQKLVILK